MAAFEDGAHDDPQVRLRGPLAKLALMVEEDWWRVTNEPDPRVLEFVGLVNAVATQEQAIKLRAARVLAWMKTKDLSPLNVPSWTACVEEFSPWSASTTREYVRLAESPLEIIREAAVEKMIDLEAAGRALKTLSEDASPEDQLAFVEAAAGQRAQRWPRSWLDVITGDPMRRIMQARDLGHILLGWPAPMYVVDDFLIECHEKKLTNEQILDRARAAPPKPDRLDKKVPDWRDDPTVSLLGEWVEPVDLHDAVRMLRQLEALLDKRNVLLGMAYYLIQYHALWTDFPECDNLEQFCIAHLGLGQRSFERYARRGLDHFQYPFVRDEMEKGLTGDRADFVLDRAAGSPDPHVRQWIELVRRLGRTEMGRSGDRDVDLRKEYAPALAMAREVEEIVKVAKEHGMGAAADRATETGGDGAGGMGGAEATRTGGDGASDEATGNGGGETSESGGGAEATGTGGDAASAIGGAEATGIGGDAASGRGGSEASRIGGDAASETGGGQATETGGVAARIALHILAQGATGDIMVAIRDDINRRFPFPEPDYIMVKPKLPAAADYVLATVVLPKKLGHRSTVKHDCFICQNPRCRRRTLRLHPHHLDEQRFGIDHHPANLVGLCPGCHLRGIHSNWMLAKRIGDWLVWTYADGSVALMYSPVEWAVTKPQRTKAA